MTLSIAKKSSAEALPETPKNGAVAAIQMLESLGVDLVFGYPGGAIMPVYDALAKSSIQHILVRHEQAAALAADAYGRTTRRAGVCLATSGPGATNLVTGIANAYMDSVPLVAITGQVAQPFMGTDAFQEVDIFGITLPIVKHSEIVRDVQDIPRAFAEAFRIAESGRPGPVLIDLPKDIQQALFHEEPMPMHPRQNHKPLSAKDLQAAEQLIASARKPLFYLGGGVARAGAVALMRDIADQARIPAVATLQGIGALPTEHPDFLGMLGMHGSRAANMAVHESDLLIVIGARFDDRATGKLDEFAPNAGVVHIDGDAAEIHKLRRACATVCGDLAASLNAITVAPGDIDDWRDFAASLKQQHAPRYDAPGSGIYAPDFLRKLSTQAGDDFVAACDVGQHQMWVAQHCRFSRPEAHLSSGGLGAMGYGLPAAIGSKLADPNKTVFNISGDGSFMMNVQELATLRRYNIPVKMVVLDNSMLGLVRQWQGLFFDGNYSEVDLSDNPDFVDVAEAFGVEGFTVEHRDEVDSAIQRLLDAKGPILAHIRIDPEENVWPLVPPGKSNTEMMEQGHEH